jgi:hypothetical protein
LGSLITVFFAEHNYNEEVTYDEMGRARSTKNEYKILAGKPERKKSLGRARLKW